MIPSFDIISTYGTDRWNSFSPRLTLPAWLEMLDGENDPYYVKESLLAITQLYFDGLVEFQYRDFFDMTKLFRKHDPRELTVLDELMDATSRGLLSYYSGEGIDASVCEAVLGLGDRIMASGARGYSKMRHLRGSDDAVHMFGYELQCEPSPHCIVPVACGAFEPALLLAGLHEVPHVVPLRYSHVQRQDQRVRLPRYAEPSYLTGIDGNVLIVEDWIQNGTSLKGVTEFVLGFEPESVAVGSVLVDCSGTYLYHELDPVDMYL
ncbi:MAG: phosphoribosyltransferase [Nanobdellota archaeon]